MVFIELGLKRLLHDGRAIVFAFDHGFEHGPNDFSYKTSRKLLETIVNVGIDGAMLLPGMARIFKEIWFKKTNLILKLTGKTNLRPESERYLQSVLGDVNEAKDYGATAVAATVYWGSPYEDLMIERWTKIRIQAKELGLPCVQLAYPRGPTIENRYDYKIVAYGVRAAVESGADLIKTYYTGDKDTFKKVINVAEGIPILMAGGPRSRTLEEFLVNVRNCLDAGCSGVAVGRNVFQSPEPKNVVRALNLVVHKNLDVKEALRT